MRRIVVIILGVAAGCLATANEALAQRNFSPNQQAGLYAYTQQLQAIQRTRQQQQLGLIARQFAQQQTAIQLERRRSDLLIDYLQQSELGGSAVPVRPSMGVQAFGDPHFGSPYFNRLGPYYNYGFIQNRNRQINYLLSR